MTAISFLLARPKFLEIGLSFMILPDNKGPDIIEKSNIIERTNTMNPMNINNGNMKVPACSWLEKRLLLLNRPPNNI
jgi:hypothetical protein